MAKFINAWDDKPQMVSLGSRKSFPAFMESVKAAEEAENFVPDAKWHKEAVAKAIIFKTIDKIAASLKAPSKISLVAGLTALLSEKYRQDFHLETIWQQQDLSEPLKDLIRAWIPIINKALSASCAGKPVGEWAKKLECWENLKSIIADLPPAPPSLPEFTVPTRERPPA